MSQTNEPKIFEASVTYTHGRNDILNHWNPPVKVGLTVLAGSLPEAVQKVYAELVRVENKQHNDLVEKAHQENTFPPKPREVYITNLDISEKFTTIL